MKKLLIFLVFLLSSSLAYSQEGTFKSVIQSGSTGSDYVYDLYVDTLGNKYITGKFKTAIDFGNGVVITPENNYDGYVAKYDSSNTIVWAKRFGGYSADEGNAITVDGDGNVLVAGVFFDTVVDGTDTLHSHGTNFDVILLKYDMNGNLQWIKQGYTENQDKPTDILVDSQGNYLLIGYFDINDSLTLPFKYESLDIMGHGERDAFVIKTDSDGNPLWGISAGGVDNLYPGKAALDGADNLYFTGYYYDTTAVFGSTVLPSADGADVFVTRVSTTGNFDWAISTTGPGTDKGTDVDFIDAQNDSESGIVLVTGYFEETLNIVNGDSYTFESVGDDDIFAMGLKADNGDCDGALSYGGTGEDQAKSIAYLPGSDGTFYVTGNTKSDLPLADSTVLTNYGGRDMFVLHFNGPMIDWAKNYGGSSYDYVNETVIDAKGNVYLGGNFKSSPATFDPFSLNSFGSYDLWIGQMKEESIRVNFFVDMSVQIRDGLFDPLTDSVFVRGDFQVDAGDVANWQGKMFLMEEAESQYFYHAVANIPADSAGKEYQYKFATNHGWEVVDNRTFDLTFPTSWAFGGFYNHDNGETAPTQNITFEVDMNVQANNGNFNASSDTVSIAGTMNGWTPRADIMTDPDADGVYSISFDLEEGQNYEYKFVINAGGWESVPNRQYTVSTFNDTVRAFYDNDSGAVRTNIAISFECNMELEIAAARFNPATDTLSARGSFNGWSDATLMVPSATDPNVYEGITNYEAAAGEEIFYKFAYTTANGTNWETGDNYVYTVTPEDITNGYAIVPVRGYNNSTLETVVNQESVIRFVVDMNGAVDGNGVAFPSIDNVVIAGANPPLAWPAGGWPDADSTLVIFMVDDGTNGDDIAGDNIWTMEVTFPIYSPLDIEYKYGANWGLSSNGGANDNEGGVGSNHHIILFPEFTYGSAYDTFGNMETKDVETSVEKTKEIPTVYSLGQNYPNPFNPSTVIKFSIPESGFVSLKVFNILGQEVASLLNESKEAGIYEVSFDASNLTTGMYIYRIQSGNFIATKKMVLIK